MTRSIYGDEWRTPDWLFDKLNEEYGPFDIDLCATRENARCSEFCPNYLLDIIGNVGSNCIGLLAKDITNKICFMNPPYSNPKPFIEKAWADSQYCKIVCLIKCDPSTSMWNTFYNFETNSPKLGCTIKLLNKRVQFDLPIRIAPTKKLSGPSFPSCILIFDRRNIPDEEQ